MLLLAGCSNKATNEVTSPETEEPSVALAEEETTESDTKVITDASGREVEIPANIDSAICIGVGSLRFTCYMEGQDNIVAVETNEKDPRISTLFSYVNNDKFKDLPEIGDNGTPYIEEIIKVQPQVVITSVALSEAEDLQEKTGIPVIQIPHNEETFHENTYETFKILGEVYNKQERGEQLTEYMKQLEADINSRTGEIPEEEKPSVYVAGVSFKGAHGFEGTSANYPPLTAIGAKNLADSAQHDGAYDIDIEQVLQWDPDIIFLDYNGMSLINEDYAKNPEFYNAFTAVKEGKVYSQISFRSFATNTELALANTYYCGSVVFPEQFEDVDPIAKADEIFTMFLGKPCYQLFAEQGKEFQPLTIGEVYE